jgi:hypothetical protein
MSLVLAAFAAETGQHLVAEPRSARFAAFRRRFDEAAYRARLAADGLRFLERLPPLLAAIHDPPTGLFLRGAAETELLGRPAVAVVGARACSGYGSAVPLAFGAPPDRLDSLDLTANGPVVLEDRRRERFGERGSNRGVGASVGAAFCPLPGWFQAGRLPAGPVAPLAPINSESEPRASRATELARGAGRAVGRRLRWLVACEVGLPAVRVGGCFGAALDAAKWRGLSHAGGDLARPAAGATNWWPCPWPQPRSVAHREKTGTMPVDDSASTLYRQGLFPTLGYSEDAIGDGLASARGGASTTTR